MKQFFNKNQIKIIIIVFAIIAIFVFIINVISNKDNKVIKKEVVLDYSEKTFHPEEIKRNYDNIRHEDIRKVVDPKYNQLADDLSDAYYNYWKQGLSHEWMGYDVLDSPKQSKEQFDKLHGLIWLWYNVEFHDYNMLQATEDRIPLDEYENKYDRITGDLLYKRSEQSLDMIDDFAQQGYILNVYEREK